MAQVSHSTSQDHIATAFHFFKVNNGLEVLFFALASPAEVSMAVGASVDADESVILANWPTPREEEMGRVYGRGLCAGSGFSAVFFANATRRTEDGRA